MKAYYSKISIDRMTYDELCEEESRCLDDLAQSESSKKTRDIKKTLAAVRRRLASEYDHSSH